MTFRTVTFPIAGPTYISRSLPLSGQLTSNMYLQHAELGKEQLALHSFPGQKLISSTVGTNDRGQHRMKEVQFKIVNDKLYQINSDGLHLAKGIVPGTDRCIFADDGENLVIVADKVFVYNSFTNVFSENTNVNLSDVLAVTIINNQFIYTSATISFMSAPQDPFDISGLDGVAAESNPDDMVRDYVFDQVDYRFGKRTTEPWYNTSAFRPPIDRIDGQQFSVGLGAIHSLVNTDKALYWLGDDKAIYRASGGINERISNDGISNAIENMTKIDDAFGHAITLQGQDFYIITFPSENVTFGLNGILGTNGWFNLTSGTEGGKYSATSFLQAYGKLIVGVGGKNLELKLNEFTQDTDTMLRERITTDITSDALGVKGKEISMSGARFIMETGVGLVLGQGDNPRLMVEISEDGGRSFKHVDWVEIGRAGEHKLQVEVFHEAIFFNARFRLSMSDPVPFSIYSGTIDLQLTGL